MNAMLPQPITLTDDLVTIARADWDALLDRLEADAGRAVVVASMTNPETDPGRRGFTAAETLRLIAGETNLRVLRDRTGLSCRALALKAGASVSYVSEVEAGKKPGSAAVLGKLAVAIGVPLEMLVG